MSDAAIILTLALIGSVLALIGGVIFLYNKKLAEKLECYSIPFAAGVLLVVAILGLLPEAVHYLGEGAFMVVLIAFLTAYVFEHFIFGIHHHHDVKHGIDYKSTVPLVIIGDTIHNFIDGVAIATSYMVSPGLGIIATISTFLHEVPHEISDFGILLKAGWKRKSVLGVNFISALFTVLGAFFVLFFVQNEAVIGILLAVAAGLFLYLGASDFLPHIHEEEVSPKKSVAALLIGALLMIFVFSLIPHTHESSESNDHQMEENITEHK